MNDEKTTTPTEVEVPVDLSWTNGSLRCERTKTSTNKTIVLVATLLVLGLTIVTLFKVQNLVYSTSYMNWRMQELESAVNDGNDDVKLIKYKLSLDESNEARAEALVGSVGKSGSSSLESQDLKLSETQNQRSKLANSLNSEPEAKSKPEGNSKGVEPEKSEAMDNDAREHPNPADPEEWIKPLVEILEDVSNHPLVNQRNENSFFRNFLELLAPPKQDQPGGGNMMPMQEPMNDGKIILNSIVRVQGRPMDQPAPEPFDFLKKMLPMDSGNIKIIHFNERPMMDQQPQQPVQQQQQPSSLEEEMAQRLGLPSVKILSPFDGINKPHIPIKFFGPNGIDKQEQPIDEVRPKIMIKSVRVKMVPLPFRGGEDFRKDALPPMAPPNMNDNIEVFRVNPESPEPSQEVEAPKFPMPFPFPFNPFHIEDIFRGLPLSPKNIKIMSLGPKQAGEDPAQNQNDEMSMSQAEKIIPEIHDLIMKTLSPPADQPTENSYNQEPAAPQEPPQDQSNVEVSKVPTHAVPLPPALMESLLPTMNNFGGDAMVHVAQEAPNQDQQPPQQQQQQQDRPQSTKLTPVNASWGEQYPEAQN